jgi:4'-phosphopantetheinyl transferase EntD
MPLEPPTIWPPSLPHAAIEAAPFPIFISPQIVIGWRRIAAGDEHALSAEELVPLRQAVTTVRRRSGAARIVARALMADLGFTASPLVTSVRRTVIWPSGLVGSLAHDDVIAVAAVGRSAEVLAVGIDVEPDAPLPADLVLQIATPVECRRYDRTLLASRRLLVAKEAAYKAAFVRDGRFLDFHDIEIDFESSTARLRYGREIAFSMRAGSHIAALATITEG